MTVSCEPVRGGGIPCLRLLINDRDRKSSPLPRVMARQLHATVLVRPTHPEMCAIEDDS